MRRENGRRVFVVGRGEIRSVPYESVAQADEVCLPSVFVRPLFLSYSYRSYNALHDTPDTALSEIAIHTLRLLRDAVVKFTFRLVQRAIVLREQEMKAKLHTKVWRLAENQVRSTLIPFPKYTC